MKLQALHHGVQASQLPLQSLAGNPNISDQDKVAEVSRQFEAVLLRQILQQARNPSPGGSSNSVSSEVYSDMINEQLADSISKSGAFGLGKSLQTELAHQVLPHRQAETLAAKNLLASAKSSQGKQAVQTVSQKGLTHSPIGPQTTLSHDRKH